MYQNFYLKLKSILEDKSPDVGCIKYNNPDNPSIIEFDQFLDKILQPYIDAQYFVRILGQNFYLGIRHDSKQLKIIVDASKKVFGNDDFGNNLIDYCKKDIFVKELQKQLNQLQVPEQKLSFEKRIKNLKDQNTFFKLFITAMSSTGPNIQKKEYKSKRKIYPNFMRNFQFEQLDVIENYIGYCQFVQQTVNEFQIKQKSLEGLEFQQKIIKIITDLKDSRQQISAVSQLLKKINKYLKDQDYLELQAYNYKLKNKELENLLREFIAGIKKNLNEKCVKQEKLNYEYLPQQGVTYQQLLHYLDCIYEDIYSVKEDNIALKMYRIKQLVQRQKQQSNSQESQRFALQIQLNELKIKMEENQKQIQGQKQKIRQMKAENNYFQNILESIFFQFNPQLKKVHQLDSSLIRSAYDQESKKIINFIEANNSKNNASMIVEQKEQKRKRKQSNSYLQEIKSIKESLDYYVQAYQSQNDSLAQKQQMIKDLESQLSQVQRQNSSLIDKSNEASQLISTLEQNIQLKQQQIRSLVQRQSLAKQQEYKMLQQKHRQQLEIKKLQLQDFKARNANNQQQIQTLKKQKITLQIQMSKLRSNYIQIKQQNEVKSNQLFELKQAQDILKEDFRQKQRQLLNQHQKQLAAVTGDCKSQKDLELAAQTQKYQREISALEQQKLDLNQQLKQFRTKYYEQMGLRLLSESHQKQKMNKQRENKKKQLEDLDRKYNQKFKSEIHTLHKQKQRLKNVIEQLKIQKQQLKLAIIEKENQIQKEKQLKQSIKIELQNLTQKKEELQRDYDRLVDDSKAIQKSFIRHSNSIMYEGELDIMQELNNNQSAPSPNLLVSYAKALFNTDIFEQDEFHKQILVKHLEEYAKSKISLTKLLYKYDPKNKVNFHQYVDNAKGLALVIKTQNAIIAGFYPETLKDKEILNKGGLLVSVTNDNSYNIHTKKPGDNNKTIFRGMIYDTFFVIYGNAQLRIKTGFKTVFSNFGVSNSYYNARGDKVNKFLNEGEKREVQFEHCEFYQVVFENPKFTQ